MATIATFAAFSSRGYSAAGGKILPTGGDYVIDNNGAGKRVHVFTSPGTFTIPTGGPITDKFTEIEVLCVGGGGDASNDLYSALRGLGGGGGGGSVVYDSAFRIPVGYPVSVSLDNGYGLKIGQITGMPAAAQGGAGGATEEYSKGWPGGSGGGGSWQNAIPNGPDYSIAHPGWTYGNSGPSAPTETKYFMPIVLNNPAQTASNVANAVSRTWNSSLYDSTKGNGQYGCTSATPDSTKGLAGNQTLIAASPPYPAVTGTFYSPKAFRMRGGGGSSYIGPLGGQGIITDFHNLENGSYDWMGAGGNGAVIDNWATWKAYPGNNGLRDSGVYNGTFYAGGETWVTSPTQVNWTTPADNITLQTWERGVEGRYSYGSGGSNELESDGQQGIIMLRYDLTAFPGGAPSAGANVFGGSITTSANGRFRYHIWTGESRLGPALKGTSANSQSYVAFGDDNGYRPRVFYGDGGGDYDWYFKKDGQDGRPNGANTDPFYYYADVPSFSVQYFMIGAGGSVGTKGTVDAGWENAFVPGGGGSGAISVGSFATPFVGISSFPAFPALAADLANASNTLVTNFGHMTTPAFNHRAGYLEVYPNSLLNSRLSTNQYVDQISNETLAPDPYVTQFKNSRERSGTIRIRGSDNSKPRLLRRDKYFALENGYFGNVGSAQDPYLQYLVLNSDFLGDPDSEGWGASIYLDSGYDHYYYNNYVRARAGRRGVLFVDQYDESTAPTTGTGDSGPDTNLVNRSFSLGTYYGGDPANFTTDATGTHPATGESYYNAIRFTEGLRKWSKASDDIPNDRWTPFYNQLSTYNASRYDNPYYWNGTADVRVNDNFTQCNKFGTPGNQQYFGRSIEFSTANSNGTVINNKFRNIYGNVNRQIKIQWVEECCDTSSPDLGKRRFRYIDHWGDDDFRLDIEAGWKAILPAVSQRIATYTNEPDELVRTYVQVWRRDLRRLVIRHLFAMDISVGNGGKGNKSASARRRSGGTTSIHYQNSDTPNFVAGAGGAGGWNGYYRSTEFYDQEPDGFIARSDRSPATFGGAGVGTNTMAAGNVNVPSTPAGSGGGAAWWMGYTQSLQQYPTPGGNAGPNGSPSNSLSAAASGGGGGGSISTRDLDMGGGLNTFKLGGATRGSGASGFSNGRQTRRSLGDADSGHGGRGYFGGTSPWTNWFGASVNLGGTDTYYALNVNQFPFNAEFSAGGGGGAGEDGGDGSLSTGGNGGAGVAYSLTGFSTIYGAGGGGFGRKINGSPGSSMPADPSAVTVPAGAPDGPAFKPYGIGGGWTPGAQEGNGADGGATQYYPGSGPWPNATPVSAGQAHMDAMRYFNSSVPAPQLGNLGSRYNGGPGVVIIAYNRAPYFT